jgi:hypothetical protein
MNESFYIPPLIFNVENRIVGQNPEDIQNVRVCVDGKQRLSSILKFVKGLVPCIDKDGIRWWWNRIGGRHRKILSNDFKNQFLAKELFCVEYNNLSFKQQEDLFARVQKGMILTEAEKLKAQKGPWQDLALDIEQDFREVVNRKSYSLPHVLVINPLNLLRVSVVAANKRASGFRNILTVAAQVMELKTIDTKMDRRARDVPALQNSGPALKKFAKNDASKCTTSAINLMTWIFRLWNKVRLHDPKIFENNNYKAAKKFSPLEFLAVGVLLFKYGAERTLTMLAGDIVNLRLHLRNDRPDIHTNCATWRVCWKFIDDLVAFRGDTEQQVDHDLPPVFNDDGTPTPRFRGRKRLPGDPRLSAILARMKQRRLNNTSSSSANVNPPNDTRANDSTPVIKTLSNRKGKHEERAAGVSKNSTSAASPRDARPAAETTRPSVGGKPAPRIVPELSAAPQRNPTSTDTATNNSVTKRKRLSVKTADGASQLLSKRKKGDQ